MIIYVVLFTTVVFKVNLANKKEQLKYFLASLRDHLVFENTDNSVSEKCTFS